MAEKRSVLEGGELFPRPVLGHSEVCYCCKPDDHYTVHIIYACIPLHMMWIHALCNLYYVRHFVLFHTSAMFTL